MTITGVPQEKHGLADYGYVPVVWMAPKLVDFEDEKATSNFCKAASGLVLGYTLLTDAKWGAAKLIPYKAHVGIDIALGVCTLAAPWVLHVSKNKRASTTLLLMGLTSIVVGSLSWLGIKRANTLA